MVRIRLLNIDSVRFLDNELTGQEADGKIGTGIFAGKTFKIDYDHNTFEIYDRQADLKGCQPVMILNDNGAFYIAAGLF